MAEALIIREIYLNSLKRMSKLLISICLINLVYYYIPESYGATQGNLGSSSSGDVNISLSIGGLTRISDLDDFIFETSGVAKKDLEAFDKVCVYTNNSGGEYQVTAEGSNNGFKMTNESGINSIGYSVFWNDSANSNSGKKKLKSGKTLPEQHGASSAIDCNGNGSARIIIKIKKNDFNNASPASYSDVLTLLIAPE